MKILSVSIMVTEQLEDFSCLTERYDGSKCWRDKQGLLHNEDGPAVIYSDGSEAWYSHGQRHRVDGPAVIHTTHNANFNGLRNEWFLNGERHRVNGPAVEYADGKVSYYLFGRRLTDEAFSRFGRK